MNLILKEMKDKLRPVLSIFLLTLAIILWLSVNSTAVESVTTDAPSVKNEGSKLLVDLDLKDVEIKDVARALSHIGGKNIIVSEEVKVKVTLRLKNIDWRAALDMILKAYNLTMIEEEDYIIITTFEKRRQAEERGDLKTDVITFNFINVEEIKKTLTSMLTTRGKIETDTRTNSLVITDIPEKIEKIKEVALQLDTKTPQVMIEAVMLTVKLGDDEQLGIDWTITHKQRPEREVSLKESLSQGSGIDLKYGKTLLSWAYFSSLIEYWRQLKKVDVLANPRVLTLDNLTAKIDLIEKVPYLKTTTTDQGTVASTDFKDVGINLYVKPHMTRDNHIFMTLSTEQSYVTGYTTDVQPIIDTRKAETNVMVKDGETIVIGGLRKKENTDTTDKLPFLSDIPFLGTLFKKTVKSTVDTELLIFVTPHITTDLKLGESESRQLERALERKEEKRDLSYNQKPSPFSLRPPLANK